MMTRDGAAFVDVALRPKRNDPSGLELVRHIAHLGASPLVVLATAHAEHATEAFDLAVADYLRKPFTDERVRICLERLIARSARRSWSPAPTRIVARTRRALVFLDLDEVWAFEAATRLTFVHTRQGRFDFDLSLARHRGALRRRGDAGPPH